jgi:hypothetical protein
MAETGYTAEISMWSLGYSFNGSSEYSTREIRSILYEGKRLLSLNTTSFQKPPYDGARSLESGM